MNRRLLSAFMSTSLLLPALPAASQAFTTSHARTPDISTAPPPSASDRDFRDSKFGVRFRVPPGWDFNRKDRQVSTFRLDARSAVPRSEMRAVANIDFNPYPLSTLSGALFYFSVERHTTDAECERQATGFAASSADQHNDTHSDLQNIGGMDFTHGHDEHGKICVEARDDVYTAFRKGSCYRFDLTVNTFCSVSSGALDLSDSQMRDIEQRMTHILSTVVLDWEKTGPRPVQVPAIPAPQRRPLTPDERSTPASAPLPAVAVGSM